MLQSKYSFMRRLLLFEHLNEIGVVLDALDQVDGALEHYEQCLCIQEVRLGSDHPLTATTYNNIGSLLARSGDYEGALEHLYMSLPVKVAVLGEEHPHVAKSLLNVGRALHERGDEQAAMEVETYSGAVIGFPC